VYIEKQRTGMVVFQGFGLNELFMELVTMS
jgi:hypothetical protein